MPALLINRATRRILSIHIKSRDAVIRGLSYENLRNQLKIRTVPTWDKYRKGQVLEPDDPLLLEDDEEDEP